MNDKRLKTIEEYAKIENVPIMEKEGIDFLTNYIKENNVKNILEIGAAIGYSAIKMCLVDKNITVTTIEYFPPYSNDSKTSPNTAAASITPAAKERTMSLNL